MLYPIASIEFYEKLLTVYAISMICKRERNTFEKKFPVQKNATESILTISHVSKAL